MERNVTPTLKLTVRLAFTLQYVFWETGTVNNDVSGDNDMRGCRWLLGRQAYHHS